MVDLPVLSRINTAIRTQRLSREFGIDALCRLLAVYLPEEQIADVREAYNFGREMHEGQFRKSGEPYIYHPLAVARILAEMRLDKTTLISAILHDVIEDTPAAKDEVRRRFGDDVAALVDGVSKLSRARFESKAQQQAESFRKLLLAMTEDIRVILVKLADRLHNMRTLDHVSPQQRRRVARETLDIYAPIANRLGIHTIRVELEDLGFQHLHPYRYQVLSKSVRQVTGNRRNLVRQIEQRLSERLKKEGLSASVVGRKKNLYSVYKKMQSKHLRFLDVMDLYGFRIIVDSVDECYRALGVVHHVYRPISEMFNDFIAASKVNGYQSLHTTLVGPGGVKIEVQIRTWDMQHIAESGIAAHWTYKLGTTSGQAPQVRAREWLKNLLDIEHRDADSMEFLESVKIDLFPDEVYVFTPKGDIRRLPRGATPVDFAYAVHTELGNSTVAARVERQLAPLNSVLENGQTVEIITARHARPNAAWLNFVKTAKARTSIRHHLRNLRSDEAVRLGKRLLEKSLRELDISPRRLKGEPADQVLEELELDDMNALYASLGLGERLAPLVARMFLPARRRENATERKPEPLLVEGTEGLVVELAKCCHPVPGDAIRGYVSVGRGVVIHRYNCKHGTVRKAPVDERLELRWAENAAGDYPVELRVQGENKRGVLAQLATIIANTGSSIENVRISERSGDMADVRFVITVSDRKHLAQVMRRLRQLDFVETVTRA